MKQRYWLAENGEVRCLDDQCPDECSMQCPIYVQTMAFGYMQNDDFATASDLLQKAVQIEPKFADAWNNLGACFGQMGNHKEAYEAFLKSFELLQKPNPLFGMATAMKNMDNFTLATQYAKIYVSRYGSDERIEELLAEISERKLAAAIDGGGERKESPEKQEKKKEAVRKIDIRTDTSVPWDKVDPATVMRQYGLNYLLLLNQETRELGYSKMEEIEAAFPEAGVVLGQYYHGKDNEKARKHLKIAADARIEEGQWGYAQLLPHSHVLVLSDPKEREYLQYCMAAAENGCPDAANEVGNICHRLKCYAESTYWYGMAHALGHRDGMAGMRGITKEWKKAGVSEGSMKCTEGFTKSRYETALLILKMLLVSIDQQDLDDLMKLTLEGENLAGFFLGEIYENKHMDDMAYTVYNALAFEGHPHAMRCYADMLLAGKGTARDVETAFQYYGRSARRGNATAMFAMGQKAAKENDPLMAAAWFGMAYDRGMDMAGDSLQKLAET